MPQNQNPSLRQRLAHTTLNLFAQLAYRDPRVVASPAGQKKSVGRILVIELWNIGDVILTMPFLAQLRGRFPRAKIALVSRPFAAELLAGTGLVDEFIPVELAWVPGTHLLVLGKTVDLWRLSRKLRQQKFDLAFSSRLHVREHLLLALSGAKRRVGFALGKRDAALTDAIVATDVPQHKVDDWLRLLGPFGGAVSLQVPRLYVKESERQWANGYLISRGIGKDDLVVGIHPGASLAEKRWPLEGFREIVVATLAQRGLRVLCFAEPSGYGSELFAIPGVVGAQVGLRELIALVERCSLLVCNDSGPMHIAGALGVPTVALFGPGIEQWFAPLGEGHSLLRPDQDEQQADGASSQNGVRTPGGIRSSRVIEAVGRAVQVVRARGTISRV